MTSKTDNPAVPGAPCPSPIDYRTFVTRAFWIAMGATLLIFLLFFSQGFIRFSETGRRLFAIFVFSICIALPSMILVTQISIRYEKKIPRLIYLVQAVCFVCTGAAGGLAAEFILWLVGICPRNTFWPQYRVDLPFTIVITLAIGMSVSVYETLRYKLQAAELALRSREVEQERANKLLAEARLSSLESHIHPHFLFNTLNSIAALIHSDPVRAEDMVAKLASLLRFSLNAQHGGLVPLAQELKTVRDYLEIESMRFGPRLRYEVKVPPGFDSVRVPPLGLQTLVENSVKHVAAQRPEGASVQVAVRRDSTQVILEVLDDGPGFSLAATTPEHGLGNLAARLELVFGPAARIEAAREDGRCAVRIAIPAEL